MTRQGGNPIIDALRRGKANGTQERYAPGDSYEGSPQETYTGDQQASQPEERRFKFISSADFARAKYSREWAIRNVLVLGQPGIIGGPMKTLKTSLMVDAAISMGTGVPFLGQFVVERPLRVAVLSGESGDATIQETALRIAKAKGIDLADALVYWEFSLPRLAIDADVRELRDALKEIKADVMLLDPAYLCLPSGSDIQPSNMFQMGSLLLGITKICLDIGVTPVLVHHFNSARSRERYTSLPELQDLAYAGFKEFARQWILVDRREAYEPGTGLHKLWLCVGGSAGQSGSWAVDMDEGVADENFSGRGWEVRITTASEERQLRKEEASATSRHKQHEKEQADDSALLKALDQLDPEKNGAGYNKVRETSKLTDTFMRRAVARLKEAGTIEEVTVQVDIGSNTKRMARGLRRVQE